VVRWGVLVHCGRLVWTFEHTSPAWIFGAKVRQNAKNIFGLLPLPIPSFCGICKVDISINLSMKCWYSAFNAQGSTLIIVVVQLGAVKIYVVAVEALRKKERQDETQFTTKTDGFLSFIPRWMLMYFFCRLFLNLTLCMTKLRVLVLCFSYFTDNSIESKTLFWTGMRPYQAGIGICLVLPGLIPDW
jgi:hypothetical protein